MQVILVVTACMSMTYPPRQQATPNYGEFGALLEEKVPAPGAYANCYDLVHFDIDPQNVFIFGNDDDHPKVPIFKVCFCLLVFLALLPFFSIPGYCH